MAVQPPAPCGHGLSVRGAITGTKSQTYMSQTLEFVVPNGFQCRRHQMSTKTARARCSSAHPPCRRGHGRRRHRQDHDRSPARGPARRSVRRGRRLPPAGQHRQDVGRDPAGRRRPAGLAGRHRRVGARPGRARRGGQQFGAQARATATGCGPRRPASSSCTSPATARSSSERMAHRQGHFMPTALLDSQFATLQPLGGGRGGRRRGRRPATPRRSPNGPCRTSALPGPRRTPCPHLPSTQARDHRDQSQRRDAGSGRRPSRSPRPVTPSWASPYWRASPSSSCSSPSSSCTPSWR